MLENVRGVQAAENSKQIEEVERRLKEINEKIQYQQKKQREASASSSSSLGGQRPDWTNSYKVWQDWVDVDELERKREATESQIENLYNQKDVLGHVHDHSEERKFFHLPEEEKIKKCEQYKVLGNYLFEEGMFDRAAKQYQTAIGFYEYIFPEDPKVQEDVDSLRIKCMCNLALCLIRLKEFRKAIEVCSSVIEADPRHYPKAYFRRGLAYKKLDEYEQALQDFQQCLLLSPEDPSVSQEISSVQALVRGYKTLGKQFAKSAIHSNEEGQTNASSSLPPGLKNFSFLNEWVPVEPMLGKDIEDMIDLQKWVKDQG